jgi:hypothetical protein
MKICGLASGECGISISWLGTRLGGPKGSRFHTDPSLLNRARYYSTGNGLRLKNGEESKSRTITSTSTRTIEEPTLYLTLAPTLLIAPAEPEEGSPSGIRFLEYEEEPGDRVAARDI